MHRTKPGGDRSTQHHVKSNKPIVAAKDFYCGFYLVSVVPKDSYCGVYLVIVVPKDSYCGIYSVIFVLTYWSN